MRSAANEYMNTAGRPIIHSPDEILADDQSRLVLKLETH